MKTSIIKLDKINIILEKNSNVFMPSKRSISFANSLSSLNLHKTRVVDVGTGSGFLAIVSSLLGAKEVLAIDIDPHSLIALRTNWKLNKSKSKLICKTSNILDNLEISQRHKFDFIISNPPALPLEVMDKIQFNSFEPWLFNGSGRDGRLFTDKLIVNASLFLKPGGSLVFVHSSRLGFDKTKRMLNKHFPDWSILNQIDFQLEDRFLPFINFWIKNKSKILKKNNKFFETVKIIKATKAIAK